MNFTLKLALQAEEIFIEKKIDKHRRGEVSNTYLHDSETYFSMKRSLFLVPHSPPERDARRTVAGCQLQPQIK